VEVQKIPQMRPRNTPAFILENPGVLINVIASLLLALLVCGSNTYEYILKSSQGGWVDSQTNFTVTNTQLHFHPNYTPHPQLPQNQELIIRGSFFDD
jgi:hypothetical protein